MIPRSAAEVAEAHAHLARIDSLTGSLAEALAGYEQAVALWEALVKEQPGDREYPGKFGPNAQRLRRSALAPERPARRGL